MRIEKGFVLSGEGPPVVNKGMWTTHIVEGIFETFEEAAAYCHSIGGELWDDEMIWVITDLSVPHRGGGKGVFRWVPVDGPGKQHGWESSSQKEEG